MANSMTWFQKNWAFLLAVGIAVGALFLSIKYANQPLLEAQDFRQTQTALTSYWMLKDGWQLNYQTPVAGYPWSIPFEFPIYQTLAAGISWLFHLSLDSAGRILSMVFLLAIAWPAKRIAKHYGLKNEMVWIFCALLWSSPLYLFWGRSFMIETAGLFFTIAAVSYLLQLNCKTPLIRNALFACAFATLAVLQKVTTILPVMAILAIWTFFTWYGKQSLFKISRNQIICFFIAYVIPLIFMQLWTSYSDFIKQENAFGKTLTSRSLMIWNFGTLQQRLSLANNYDIFVNRVINHNIASLFGVVIVGAALIFGRGPVRKAIVLCLLLFILPILIFFNLHNNHNYYQTSCAIFLIAALAISVGIWLPQYVKRKFVVAITILLIVGFNMFIFFTRSYGRNLRADFSAYNDSTLAISKIIRESTRPNSSIIVFGNDWSSTIAYYSERKSFTVPDSWCLTNKYWDTASLVMGNTSVEAIVCLPNNCIQVNQLLQKPEIKARPQIFRIFGGYLWLPNATIVRDPFSKKDIYPLSLDSLRIYSYDGD